MTTNNSETLPTDKASRAGSIATLNALLKQREANQSVKLDQAIVKKIGGEQTAREKLYF